MTDPQFLRQYKVKLSDSHVSVEFDSGFLTDARFYKGAHNHAGIELMLVKEGECEIHTDDGIFSCSCGDLLLIPVGVYHRTEEPSGRLDRFCCRIYPSGDTARGEFAPLLNMLGTLRTTMSFRLGDLLPLMESIRKELIDDRPAVDEMVTALLGQIFIIMLRYTLGPNDSRTAEPRRPNASDLARLRIKQIERFFSNRYAEQVTLKDLADSLYISPTQTNRILAKHYRRSFREKLRDTRLHQAKLMLLSTDRSVNSIAADVGYISLSGFYAAFRREFGITPERFRNSDSSGG